MYLHIAVLILLFLSLFFKQLITKTGRVQYKLIIRVLENHAMSRHLNNLIIMLLPNHFEKNNYVSNLILFRSKKTHPFNTLKELPVYIVFLVECADKVIKIKITKIKIGSFCILYSGRLFFPISNYTA